MAVLEVPVRISWSGASGGPGVNIWHLRYDESLSDIGSHIDQLEAFYTACSGIYPTTCTITIPGDGTSVEAEPKIVHLGNARIIQGTGGTEYLAPECQIVVGWSTLSATRSGHGRTFLGPLWQDVCDQDGSPTPGVLSGVRDAAAALVAANQPDDSGAWGVYSVKDGVIRDFVGSAVRDQFASLRSRRD